MWQDHSLSIPAQDQQTRPEIKCYLAAIVAAGLLTSYTVSVESALSIKKTGAHTMKFQKAFNVTTLTPGARANIHPGQWVFANGNRSVMGQYMGQTKAGVDVIAWAPGKRSSLRAYAKRQS